MTGAQTKIPAENNWNLSNAGQRLENKQWGREIYVPYNHDVWPDGMIDFSELDEGVDEDRFSTRGYDNNMGYFVVPVLTPIQQSIADIVTGALGDEWIFRQLRDVKRENGDYESPLKAGHEGTSLVLLYQRNGPVDAEVYATDESHKYKEPPSLTEKVTSSITENVSTIVKPRYGLREVEVEWGDWQAGQGEWDHDPRYICVKLYFSDAHQELDRLKGEVKTDKTNVAEKQVKIHQLEDLLSK